MKSIKLKIIISVIFLSYSLNAVYADDVEKADKLMKKAVTASSSEIKYDYVTKARDLYKSEYDKDEQNIKVLLGLSKTFQMTQNREEAKLYLLKAYNIKPYDPALQKEMGDFYYNFQEYTTALEYYKLALSSGYLENFETNFMSAKCYEKLGDKENAQLYYQICGHVKPSSRKALNKINEYDSMNHPDNTKELENAKYKYLFKDKKPSKKESVEQDAQNIIDEINNLY